MSPYYLNCLYRYTTVDEPSRRELLSPNHIEEVEGAASEDKM